MVSVRCYVLLVLASVWLLGASARSKKPVGDFKNLRGTWLVLQNGKAVTDWYASVDVYGSSLAIHRSRPGAFAEVWILAECTGRKIVGREGLDGAVVTGAIADDENSLSFVVSNETFVLKLPVRPRISGKIIDGKTGRPIAGAKVAPMFWREPAAALSNSKGVFDLGAFADANPLSPSDARIELEISAPRYATVDWKYLKPGEVIDLELARSISVRVLDSSGTGVSNAEVYVRSRVFLEDRQFPTFTGHTDSSGTFRVAALPRGEAMLSVEAEGFLPSREDLKIDRQDAVVTLKRTTALDGIVIFNGAPVSNAEIEACAGTFRGYALSDAKGHFRMGVPEQVDVELVARSSSAGRASITVLAGNLRQHRPIELPLVRASVFAGRVLGEDSRPIAEVRVAARIIGIAACGSMESDAVTDSNGNFSIRDLEPGAAHLTVWPSDQSMEWVVSDSRGADVDEDNPYDGDVLKTPEQREAEGVYQVPAEGVTLMLHRKPKQMLISGTVVDHLGRTVMKSTREKTIRLMRPGDTGYETLEIRDGHFETVVDPGSYTVQVCNADIGKSEPLSVGPEDASGLKLKIVPSGLLTGRVVEHGSAVADVSVHISSEERSRDLCGTLIGKTDNTGRFELNAPSGRVRLSILDWRMGRDKPILLLEDLPVVVKTDGQVDVGDLEPKKQLAE